MVPTLAGVILLIFFLFKFFGGDPAQILAGQVASQEQIDAIRRELGLDQPWYAQLAIFVREIISFDFGKSWMTREQVSDIFLTRLPATLTITLPILVLEVSLAIPTAMLVAYYRGTLLDRTVMAICVAAMSISFLVYIIVGQYVLGFQLGWFPVQGWSDDFWRNLFTYAPLPILLAALVGLAPQTRLYRSFFLDETKSDYVRTARAKGLSEPAIMRKHVLRNALVPVLTNVSLLVLTMLINLAADVLYTFVDPRIQLR
jgi:peptide/nickel transport system permease protein